MKAVSTSIRPARSSDLERIIEIERSWEHLSHWSVDAYYRLLDEDPATLTFVAELEDDTVRPVVGFVIFHIAGHVAEIYNIAVDRRYRSVGIGRMLMTRVIDGARRRGARRIILEVRKSNDTAIAFYTAFDFRMCGERTDYYTNPREDAFVMDRDLRL